MSLGTTGRRILAAASLTLIPLAATAQQGEPEAARTVEVIDTVTIIGRAADAADVPGSAHVVSSEELDDLHQSDILRVLRTVPGVYVQEEEGFGLRPNIGIHVKLAAIAESRSSAV